MNNRPHGLPPLWAIWRNPIVVRCWRSRMRLRGFLPWAVIVVVLCAFVFFMVFNALSERMHAETAMAARACLLPMLIIQGVILLLLGTGAVTTNLTIEEDEGMIEFQRLTPLPPAWKIAGYLFGLPVREYVLFALTLPFTIAVIWLGHLPLAAVVKVYAVLATSTVLYHLTGYVAGFTLRKRKLGSRLVQIAVIMLYLVLPQLSNFGYVVFEHLTIRPVFREQLSHYVLEGISRYAPRSEKVEVAFYGLELPQVVFSLIIQSALICVFIAMVRQKWLDAARHTLGKFPALVVMTGVAVLVLGNLLPLITDGRVFPTRLLKSGLDSGLGRAIILGMVPKSSAAEAGMLVALLAMLLTVLGVFLLLQITPTRFEAIRGWRRAARLGQPRLPWLSDEATALPWAVLFGVVAGLTVWLFGRAMGHSVWMAGKAFAQPMVQWVALLPVLVFCSAVAVAETWERKGVFILVMVVWVLPALVMLVLTSASDHGATIGFYVGSISPLAAYFSGMVAADAQWAVAGLHGPRAFFCGFGLHLATAAVVFAFWWRAGRSLRVKALDRGPRPLPAP